LEVVATERKPFGGLRWWFVCPLKKKGCLGRVDKLYRRPDWALRFVLYESPMGCRACNRVFYESSRQMKPSASMRRMAAEMGVPIKVFMSTLREKKKERMAREKMDEAVKECGGGI
jgi:hypothetical protein